MNAWVDAITLVARPVSTELVCSHRHRILQWVVSFITIALAVSAVALIALPHAQAQSLRVLVQSSPLAGFRYHAAAQNWEALKVGDALELVREPSNPHDRNAIRVEWRGELLGYVPRRDNATLAWAIDRGERVAARISRLQQHLNPRERMQFEVYAE